MSARVYLEGGGDSKDLHSRCREGFSHLLRSCGFSGRMPRLTAGGGRNATFDDFQIAHRSKGDSDFIAMLIDSEEPLSDPETTWPHLEKHDGWKRPDGASNKQVLFMTTCMETWIVADRAALSAHFGSKLQVSALPASDNLESRPRQDIQRKLTHATRNCVNAYEKGARSFELLGKLSPPTLQAHLPSFRRVVRVLDEKL